MLIFSSLETYAENQEEKQVPEPLPPPGEQHSERDTGGDQWPLRLQTPPPPHPVAVAFAAWASWKKGHEDLPWLEFQGSGKAPALAKKLSFLPNAALSQMSDVPSFRIPSLDEGLAPVKLPFLCGKVTLQAASLLLPFDELCIRGDFLGETTKHGQLLTAGPSLSLQPLPSGSSSWPYLSQKIGPPPPKSRKETKESKGRAPSDSPKVHSPPTQVTMKRNTLLHP
ncbi:hypothetical protein HPG69_017722 [Diceros bicornis minor]|uniref:Uncharacterized protein n=1 Tax=Diceros bicornis minor TaxID=77932 RepID=A0A7J7FGQ8_DICBM|nr:hypothetical protein HPG69_017722 [Diceros bicornis minor]